MVAAGQPLAASVGLQILAGGGNAYDAALAMAAAIAVVEPAMNSIGGDAFCIAHRAGGRPYALNASGPAPLGASAQSYGERINPLGLAAASIPGAIRAWQALHSAGCSKSWADLLAPAISYAREGIATSASLAAHCRQFAGDLARFPASAAVFLPQGQPLLEGQLLVQGDLARTLEEISASGDASGFYDGSFAANLEAHARRSGQPHRASDLQLARCDQLDPLAVSYLDHRVCAQPPVSQGYVTLAALRIGQLAGAGQLEFADPQRIHLAIEAKKAAFGLRHRFLGDPAFEGGDGAEYLSDDHLAEAAASINPASASQPPVRRVLAGSDTTCLAAADDRGNSIAYIQSIFAAFGCREMIPDTGVMMNNRMTGFSLDPASPNFLRGGRRPAHTLMTWMALQGSSAVAFGSTAGGHYQVQTNQQLIESHLRYRLPLQSCFEAPRWGHDEETGHVFIEDRFGRPVAEVLQAMGHNAHSAGLWGAGSRGLAIGRNLTANTLTAGCDPRWHGTAIGY